MAPPEIPGLRLKALQEAFMRTMEDPELVAEAQNKNLGIKKPMSGPDMKTYVNKIYALPKAAKELVKNALANKHFAEPVSYTSFNAQLSKIKKVIQSMDATLQFKKEKEHSTVRLNAPSTMVTAYGNHIKPPPLKIKSLDIGMKCEVFWTGPDTTAHKLVCGK